MSDELIKEIAAHAYQALKAKQYNEARVLIDEILELDAENLFAHKIKGLIELAERRFDDAIRSFTFALRDGGDFVIYANLATCYLKCGDAVSALACCRQAISLNPEVAEGHLCAAVSLQGIGAYEEALEHTEIALRLDKSHPGIAIRRGAILSHMGCYQEAQEIFASIPQATAPHCRAIKFDSSFFGKLNNDIAPRVPDCSPLFKRVRKEDFRQIVFAACDGNYFLKYGPSFLTSFGANAAQDTLLCLHIIEPHVASGELLQKVIGDLEDIDLIVTKEHSPIDPEVSAYSAKTYYSCARFMHLPDMLAQYKKPIIVVDIDLIFEANLGALIEFSEDCDITFVKRNPPDAPWLDIAAHLIVINPSAASLKYFSRVRNYVIHFIDQEEMPWHLDQIALYCTLAMTSEYGISPNIKWFTKALQERVWQLGSMYDYKLSSEKFKRYST